MFLLKTTLRRQLMGIKTFQTRIDKRNAHMNVRCPEFHTSQCSTSKATGKHSSGCFQTPNVHKPPNVLVYSENNEVRATVIATMKNILHPDRYTIYPLKNEQLENTFWIDNTKLLVVCGPTLPKIRPIFIEYFLCGGKMLCLYSDVLNLLLLNLEAPGVYKNELAQFSYGRWQNIQLVHDILVQRSSPPEEHTSSSENSKPPMTCPKSVDLTDKRGDIHRLELKILATEETCRTPSLILATDTRSNGVAVFSQVHLEAEPNSFETDDFKFKALTKNDTARLEILSDIVSTQLGFSVQRKDRFAAQTFPSAYFLGQDELKSKLLEKIKPQFIAPKTLKTNSLDVKFYGRNEMPQTPLDGVLPILLDSNPENFSASSYFDALKTREIGRLLVYAPVIDSTMTLVSNSNMQHGFAVVGRNQTAGVGRTRNQWLSPEGCALFSVQIHIPLSSALGQRLPLLQHLVSVAIVNSIMKSHVYEKLDIRLKWPNDILANGQTKLGGLIVNTELNSDYAICNVGVGFNLDNSIPTTCINDLIKSYNSKHGTSLPHLEYERFFANVFNETEQLIDKVQTGNFTYFHELYYKFWMHSDAEIEVIDANGHKKTATTIGIDEFGYLVVKQANREPESVHPDGNTFDILRGLISAKHF